MTEREESPPRSFLYLLDRELGAILPTFAQRLRRSVVQMGGLVVMVARVADGILRPPYELGTIAYQVEELGIRSLSIATLTAVFAGFIISLQFAFFLARFGVQHTVGNVVVIVLFRELGPVLTALTVGARIGSGIAAELGSMVVTEQVDAIRALGADPVKRLVVPRVVACFLVLPGLTMLSDVFGLLAGALVVKIQYGIPFEQYFSGALHTVELLDFESGVLKSAVFGLIIAFAGCFKGFSVEGGTEGVGRVTTETVAAASVAICLADFILTKIIILL
jgi:phospholipid/cholesterol/gamma-HCH transport system permease protein